jgi:hypothetical protein
MLQQRLRRSFTVPVGSEPPHRAVEHPADGIAEGAAGRKSNALRQMGQPPLCLARPLRIEQADVDQQLFRVAGWLRVKP